MKKVYLAGQWNQYENNWKEEIKKVNSFSYYDPEIDSNQNSSDTYYVEDMEAVKEADILIANPGMAPSEAMWVEVGYFLAWHTKNSTELCPTLIILWKDERKKWSKDFVDKAGHVTNSLEGVIAYLKTLT
jgi:hypothetical protein